MPASDTTPDRRRSLPCPRCGEPVPARGGSRVLYRDQRWHRACWDASHARPGNGRPKGPPTRVLSVRVPAAHYDYLKGAVVALVGKLVAQNGS